MSRPAITAEAFALTAGAPCDPRQVLHVDPEPPPDGRRLLVSVEPLEPSARGFELASLALDRLREAFAAARHLPPAAALTQAFAAANAALLDENRPLAGCRWQRRVYVGATAIVVGGRHLTIAQVPPTQALFVQDRRVYAFPDLASWRTDYVPATDQPDPDPLGCREGTRPCLYRTVAAPGDLILLCSSTLARHLGRDAAAAAVLRAEPVLQGKIAPALEGLGHLAAAYELDDVHVAGIALGRVPAGIVGHRLDPGALWGRLGAAWTAVAPGIPAFDAPRPRPADPLAVNGVALRSRVGHLARRSWAGVGVPIDRPLPPAPADATAAAVGSGWPTPAGVRPGWVPHRPPPAAATAHEANVRHRAVGIAPGGGRLGPEPPVFAAEPPAASNRRRPGVTERVQLWLTGLSERLSSRRRPATIQLAARQRALAAPGAASVRRYTGQTTLPIEWRANLPRAAELPVSGRLLTVGLVIFLGFGGSGFAFDQHREKSDRIATALATVDERLQALAADEATAGAALTEAEAALATARRAGAGAEVLGARQRALDFARDRAWGLARLTEMTRVGTLPDALAGRSVRLVRVGRDVYLVGGGLYLLDAEGRRLVRLLAPGETVDGGVVGDLQAAAADPGGLVVTDGEALYARDGSGRWTRRPLAPVDGAMAPARAIAQGHPAAAFQGSFYAVAEAGHLLKFPAEDPGVPIIWASADDYPELAEARDLAIDGRVHVMLGDGRVLTFFRGALDGTLEPDVVPPLAEPVALDGGPDANFLYVAEAGVEIGTTAGRIVRLDAAGGVRQILAPIPADGDAAGAAAARALGDVRDLVVDEEAGVVYFVTERDLWRAALPPSVGSRQ